MIKMYADYLKALLSSKKGQGMVEYGLIISLIAVAVIVVLGALGGNLSGFFGSVSNKISPAT